LAEKNIIYFDSRDKWRKWLEDNFDREKEVWLKFPLKTSGRQRLSYNDAVEEALCFGWIDSTINKLDKDHTIQRFSRRNPKSTYSQLNKERIKLILDKGIVHSSVEKKIREIAGEEFLFPEDIMNEIKKDQEVWKNFQGFSDSYKRIRIAYIDAARVRPEEFKKRFRNFIEKTKKNKLVAGNGGSEKYY
jgi:uncharacterized protein YdeI (YjbR/CyaY-like superfamily)